MPPHIAEHGGPQAPHNDDHPKYRPDIDGLRAIAVLSVIGFHAFPKTIKGGFVGVDIFFVISGFLISSIILAGLENRHFSFMDFYGRRIRRIFPALLAVLATSAIFGWFLLLAEEFQQLGKHTAGGAGFVSNLLLWGESGYFDNDAETKPLLHLWSLGIEEQFYIIWPLLLWLAWKLRFSPLLACLTLAVISFAFNLAWYRSNPVGDFFSPMTRFWELLAGALLAYRSLKKSAPLPLALSSRWQVTWGRQQLETYRDALSITGLLFIVLALIVTKQKHFPGLWAILPVWGSLMLIAAGPHGIMNRRLLAKKTLVWFGLISFPLYLWHWPILSFARIVEADTPGLLIRCTAVLLTLFLAQLTYHGIEKPLRFGHDLKQKTLGLLIAMIAMGAGGYLVSLLDGLPSRQGAAPESMLEGDIGHLDYHRYVAEKYYPCTPESIFLNALKWQGYTRCMQSRPGESVDLALMGDSHAEHLFIGLAEQLPERNIAFYIRSEPAFLDHREFQDIYKHVLANQSIRQVILTMYWEKRQRQLPAGVAMDKEILKAAEALIASGKEVFITDDVPAFPYDPMKCKVRRAFLASQQCDMERQAFERTVAAASGTLTRILASNPRIRLLETAKYFCGQNACAMNDGQKLLYRDRHHLNINGSKFLGEQLAPVLKLHF